MPVSNPETCNVGW